VVLVGLMSLAGDSTQNYNRSLPRFAHPLYKLLPAPCALCTERRGAGWILGATELDLQGWMEYDVSLGILFGGRYGSFNIR
jgi:hypothetical protein